METAAFTFGTIGLVFGIIAVGQVNELKRELQRMKVRLEGE